MVDWSCWVGGCVMSGQIEKLLLAPAVFQAYPSK